MRIDPMPYEEEYEEPEPTEQELLKRGLSDCEPLRGKYEGYPGQAKSKCYIEPRNANGKATEAE